MLGTLNPGEQAGAIIGIILAALILCCCCVLCLWLLKDKQAATGIKRLTADVSYDSSSFSKDEVLNATHRAFCSNASSSGA